MNTGRRNVLKMMGMGAAGLAFAPFVKATDILDEATMSQLDMWCTCLLSFPSCSTISFVSGTGIISLINYRSISNLKV